MLSAVVDFSCPPFGDARDHPLPMEFTDVPPLACRWLMNAGGVALAQWTLRPVPKLLSQRGARLVRLRGNQTSVTLPSGNAEMWLGDEKNYSMRLISSAFNCLAKVPEPIPWNGLGEMIRGLVSVLLSSLLGACGGREIPERQQARTAKLSMELRALDPSVGERDADLLATTAVVKSAELAHEYKPLPVPWLNNNLVNSGFRPRGLCWHWRDDLFPHLHKLRLRTLDLFLATAKPGSAFEHNAIVVTARRRPFSDGIVLDPWRSGGSLSWAKVSTDRYPWVPLAPELTPDSLRPLFKGR